ncbi:MAG: hypothetical protein WAX69_00910 [Victivallales bacterium]
MFRKKWDAKSIINHILARHGRKPLNSSFYAATYPAVYAAAERLFGSWGSAIESCGISYDTIRKYQIWTHKRVIREIKAKSQAGASLNSNHVQKNSKSLYMASVKRFKSWGNAVEAAGLSYGKIRLRRKLSRPQIKGEILGLHRKKIDLSYTNIRKNYQYLLAAGMKKLGGGSWVKARRKCGIRGNYRLNIKRRANV